MLNTVYLRVERSSISNDLSVRAGDNFEMFRLAPSGLTTDVTIKSNVQGLSIDVAGADTVTLSIERALIKCADKLCAMFWDRYGLTVRISINGCGYDVDAEFSDNEGRITVTSKAPAENPA